MTEHPAGPPGRGAEPGHPEIDHEINRGGIVRTGIWLAGITLGSFLVAFVFYRVLASAEKRSDPKPSPLAGLTQPGLPPAPLLQVAPERELAAMRAAEEARLTGWGWVDEPAGVAYVPVERAIDAIAKDGRLPDFSVPPAGGSPQ
jgi:hypothetical protein